MYLCIETLNVSRSRPIKPPMKSFGFIDNSHNLHSDADYSTIEDLSVGGRAHAEVEANDNDLITFEQHAYEALFATYLGLNKVDFNRIISTSNEVLSVMQCM